MTKTQSSILMLSLITLAPSLSFAAKNTVAHVPEPEHVYQAPPTYVVPTVGFEECHVYQIWNGAKFVFVQAPDCMAAMIRDEIIADSALKGRLQTQMDTCKVPITTPTGVVNYYDSKCVDKLKIDKLGFWMRIRPYHGTYYAARRPKPVAVAANAKNGKAKPAPKKKKILGLIGQLEQMNSPKESSDEQQTPLTAKLLDDGNVSDQSQENYSSKPAAI